MRAWIRLVPSRRPAKWRSIPRPGSISTGSGTTGWPAPGPALEASPLGALLLFDVNNIRYVTSTAIGEWSRDKMTRYALLARTGGPMVWDFGSAAKHHRQFCPWLEQKDIYAGLTGLRGAIAPEAGLFQKAAEQIFALLREAGVETMPLGLDYVEPPLMFELQKLGITVVDGQQVMLDAREIKSYDEIMLLSTSAAMVDGTYQDIVEALKPGVKENEIVALATKRLYELGADDVESINAVFGRALQPASAQLQRPDHPARRSGVLRYHVGVQRLPHVLLPYVQRRLRHAGPEGRLQAVP